MDSVMDNPIYLAIEGVIGVGKTTLATLLQERLQAESVLEIFEENPFLADFYVDPARYAFHVQMTFLMSRYRQQQAIWEWAGRRSLVSDYTFAKDRLFARLNLQGPEWESYEQLHEILSERIILPDLLIYLRASVDTLMARIAQRGRPYERNMSRAYIARLAAAYDEFFANYSATPVLVIEADELDIVQNPGDLAEIEAQICARLTPSAIAHA